MMTRIDSGNSDECLLDPPALREAGVLRGWRGHR